MKTICEISLTSVQNLKRFRRESFSTVSGRRIFLDFAGFFYCFFRHLNSFRSFLTSIEPFWEIREKTFPKNVVLWIWLWQRKRIGRQSRKHFVLRFTWYFVENEKKQINHRLHTVANFFTHLSSHIVATLEDKKYI